MEKEFVPHEKSSDVENWNQLEYAKYHFWQEAIHFEKKEIIINAYLEIDYNTTEDPCLKINTQIDIENNGFVIFPNEKHTCLHNLFKMENLNNSYLYLLPFEEKVVKRVFNFGQKKITEFVKANR